MKITIPVLYLVRENERFLENMFVPMWEGIESYFRELNNQGGIFIKGDQYVRDHNVTIDFEYYFFENDSTDNTRTIVQEFLKDRSGQMFNETYDSYFSVSLGSHTARFERMSRYRNALLDRVRPILAADIEDFEWNRVPSMKYPYSILMDTDVYVAPSAIVEMVKHMQSPENLWYCPSIPGTAMVGAFGYFIIRDYHYYDTLALRTKEPPNEPMCITIQCPKCKPHERNEKLVSIYRNEPVEVDKLFGGCVMVRNHVLFRCKWSTNGVCEHHNFCEEVSKFGKIELLPAARTSWHKVFLTMDIQGYKDTLKYGTCTKIPKKSHIQFLTSKSFQELDESTRINTMTDITKTLMKELHCELRLPTKTEKFDPDVPVFCILGDLSLETRLEVDVPSLNNAPKREIDHYIYYKDWLEFREKLIEDIRYRYDW